MTPLEQMLDAVEWAELPIVVESGAALPYATHKGVLKILDGEFTVYQLNDGRRVFDAADIETFFNLDEAKET